MNLQLMYNRQLQKSKHSAKALVNSKASVITCFCTYTLIPRLCGLFSFHVVWKQYYILVLILTKNSRIWWWT